MKSEQIIQRVKLIALEYQEEMRILFGSRALGTDHNRSDFDFAVSGVADFDGLKEEIESIPTLYSFDVVNFDTCKNKVLKEEIIEHGQKII